MTRFPLTLTLAATLGLGLATGVFAQSSDTTAPGTPDASATGTGTAEDISARSWNEPVREVFFTDATMTEIRPTEEVETRWAALDPEEKQKAKRDCAAFLIDAGAMGGAGGPSQGDTAAQLPGADGTTETGGARDPSSVSTDTTTTSDAPASPGDATLWNQACALVKSFDPE